MHRVKQLPLCGVDHHSSLKSQNLFTVKTTTTPHGKSLKTRLPPNLRSHLEVPEAHTSNLGDRVEADYDRCALEGIIFAAFLERLVD